jgi:multimeric flavodoxin WrbA
MIKLIDILNEIGLPGDLADLKELNDTIKLLSGKKKVLLLASSNRYQLPDEPKDVPKSTQLALAIKKSLGNKAILMDVSELIIHHCEGNVSRKDGNSCGVKGALLKDKQKDPSGYHRCWASINNSDDELWKITKELFECDAVVFFTSVRWGQTNAFYQILIERLTWIENRHTTLQEDNVVKDIATGFICIGQNWNGEVVVETQKKVHEFFGFQTPKELYWNWQYTKDSEDESEESYVNSIVKFKKDFNIK